MATGPLKSRLWGKDTVLKVRWGSTIGAAAVLWWRWTVTMCLYAYLGHRTVESSAIGPHRQTYALNQQVSRGGAATHIVRVVLSMRILDRGSSRGAPGGLQVLMAYATRIWGQ